MALQGTLDTFALPDVLHLLAATKKTGCLRLTGPRGTGSVWVESGETVAVAADHAPLAVEPVDALFELLRFEEGSFGFEPDQPAPAPGVATDVDSLLDGAGALLAEWREIESVVPSLDAHVTLRRHLDGDAVTISSDQWPAMVAVGDGTTVRGLGERLQLAELPVSRAVRDLVELGVVELELREVETAPPAPVTDPSDGVAAAVQDAAETADADVPQVLAEPAAEEPAIEPPVAPAAEPAALAAPLAGGADAEDADDAPPALPPLALAAVDDGAPADDDLPVARPIRARRPRPRTVERNDSGEPERFVPLDLPGHMSPAAASASAPDEELEGPLDDLAAAFPGLAGRAADPLDGDDPAMAPAAAGGDDLADVVDDDAAVEADAPINRGLLLKFLGTAKS